MEWVETTGRTIAEALEAALDQLGVAEADAEVVVLEEPRSAMFGLRRSGARIRARVRPVQARAKRPSRRPSNGGSGEARSHRGPKRPDGRAPSAPAAGAPDDGVAGARTASGRSEANQSGRKRSRGPSGDGSRDTPKGQGGATGRSRGTQRGGTAQRDHAAVTDKDRPIRSTGAPKEEEMSIEAQAELAETFVRGVVDGFGMSATVESSIDDDVIQVRVLGDGLGLLVGPRGVTVDALQELTRTAVQHRSDEHAGRIHVDVAGYRARRAAALKDFARRVAEEVVTSGQAQALEPMNAVDRKAVHDAVGEVAGVATSSEGEDPRRYVVVRPAAASAVVGEDADDIGEDVDDGDAE
ncbi:MAG: RNA-binding cell elongation regulator Jag/EloR [Acidimicrobiales bacterium]